MIYIVALDILKTEIYFSRVAKIIAEKLVQVAVLQQDRALIEILLKYTDYADIFLYNLAIELLENTSINKHAIKSKKSK